MTMSEEQKRQISATLKKKWEDPEFRAEQMKTRKTSHLQSPEVALRRRQAMQERMKDPELRQRAAEPLLARWNRPGERERQSEAVRRGWTEESRKLAGERQKKRRHSPETREKMRRSAVASHASESRKPRADHFWLWSGYHRGIWMRCLNSEGVFARELDSAGVKWVYEPEKFKLSWCTYLPDFYLPEFDIWVEVKGWVDELSQRKIDSFRSETGKTLVVVLQEELSSLEY